MFRLICMSFDGDYVTEGRDFKTVQVAWERAADMGSRWFFYPFSFVTTASGKTIKDAPRQFEHLFKGLRVKTVVKIFKQLSKRPEAQEMDVEQFADFVMMNA